MNYKEKGSFYTPKDIALWVSQRSLSSAVFNALENESINVLEPSCGDGSFLRTIDELSAYKDNILIDAVESDDIAIEKARCQHPKVNFYHEDFLFWKNKKIYDVILGNPPYIVKKILSSKQFVQCKKIHVTAGLQNKEVANIWTAFVIKCSEMLSDKGVLAFVLPTELLQVNYTKEIRSYLLEKFKRVEVVSFKNLTFQFIDQDTVILMAYKSHTEKGLYFSEATSVNELNNLSFEIHHGDNDSKWSSYILKEDEIKFIKNIAQKCSKVSDLCSSVAGIVTAANNYFIVSKQTVDKCDLGYFIKPIIQKGQFVNGSAELSKQEFKVLIEENKPCYLLDLNNVSENDFTDGLKSYLEIGKEQDIPQRFKCRIRGERWFDIPSIWKSEGFFFKRGHHYPKLLVNKADVYVTDSAYRIRMKEGMNIENFTMSFYNSLTLLFAELNGRYYGGGVLELTPNEFKGLPIPKYIDQPDDYKKFIQMFNKKKSIEEFLLNNDHQILSSLDISEADIKNIHNLYIKVKSRRLRSNK